MRKIIIPIDFSKCSEYACKTASKIARKTNSEIHLLHMVEVPSGIITYKTRSSFSIPESMLYIRKVRDRMLNYKEKFFKKNKVVKHSIRFQPPYEGISSYSKKIDADLIVMGSKGHSKLDEIMIGSNTERTVRTSDIPVLVVKNDREVFDPKNIVFASDFNEQINPKNFKKLVDFADMFKSKIHLLKVNTPKNFQSSPSIMKKIKEFIKKHAVNKHNVEIYNDNSIENGILNYSKDIDADLIGIGTHGRSSLANIFNISISKNITKRANRPILTFKI